MKYRKLGETGLLVSTIGFGGWGIGGNTANNTSYGETDDAVSLKALKHSAEQGITFYDTSPAYGEGHSEVLIGQALKHVRKDIVIATKAGYLNWSDPPDFSADGIRRSVAGSLERLQTNYIDLLQLHNAPIDLLCSDPTIVGTLEALVIEGTIRAWGLSVKSPAEGVAAIERFKPKVIQTNINMLDMRVASSGLLDAATQEGTGLIARTPLCFGFLAGTLKPDSVFPPGDHRNGWSRKQIARWLEGAEKMRDIADPERHSTASKTALRFCLSVPGVACSIPGIMTAEEATVNAVVGDSEPLDRLVYDKILEVNSSTDFVVPQSRA